MQLAFATIVTSWLCLKRWLTLVNAEPIITFLGSVKWTAQTTHQPMSPLSMRRLAGASSMRIANCVLVNKQKGQNNEN